MNAETLLLEQALSYYRLGWSIIPVGYETKKPPLVKWIKYQKQRPSEEQVRKWFSEGKKNIAVVLGEVSGGLTCRDFDTLGEYELWAKDYPALAKRLPTVKTAHGRHVYFEGHFEGIKHISNGELRGGGGYCLIPPSIHPDGPVYQWINPLVKSNLLAIEPENAGFLKEKADTEHVVCKKKKKRKKSVTEETEDIEAIRVCGSYNKLNKALKTANVTKRTNENQEVVYNKCDGTEQLEQLEHVKAIKEEGKKGNGNAEGEEERKKRFIRSAIERTLPEKVRQRNNKIFFFAKALRTEYSDADPKIFREDVRNWYNLALPNIRTKEFAETWLDFLVAWDNVKYFEGVNPMIIYEKAIKLEPPKTVAINYPDNRKIQSLAVLCREMQKACGDNPFFLSARTAAGLLEISPIQANRYLRLLVREDVLLIIQKGGTAGTVRKATRYRYIATG